MPFLRSNPKSNTVVFYHANCADGFVACWLVAIAHVFENKEHAEYVRINYDKVDVMPDVSVENRHVLIVDFAFSPEVTEQINKTAKSVITLDHHKTALNRFVKHCGCSGVDGNVTNPKILFMFGFQQLVRFDMEKSGASLVYDYVLKIAKDLPNRALYSFLRNINVIEFVSCIEDRDLFRLSDPRSLSVHAALTSTPYSFDTLKWLMLIMANMQTTFEYVDFYNTVVVDNTDIFQTFPSLDAFASYGNVVKKINDNIVEDISRYHDVIYLVNPKTNQLVKGKAINAPARFATSIGALRRTEEEFVLVYSASEDKIICSLRSHDKGANVRELAEYFAGGGHDHASGFSATSDLFFNILTASKQYQKGLDNPIESTVLANYSARLTNSQLALFNHKRK